MSNSQDTFEDAHDAAPDTTSVRSLTQRSLSNNRPPPAEPAPEIAKQEEEEEDQKDEPHGHVEAATAAAPVEPIPEPVQTPHHEAEEQAEAEEEFVEVENTSVGDDDEATLAHKRISVHSNGQLDNVSLDDETNTEELKGADTEQRSSKKLAWLTGQNPDEAQIKMSPSEPEPEPQTEQEARPEAPKKTISLSSITNSLPAMPWSPGAPPQVSPTSKNLDAPLPAAAPAATPTSPGAPPAGASNPTPTPAPPPSRKLAGAFSWLSRSSSKDLTNVTPPVVSTRRNTASSTTTLTSNPEMMLGKLEEEGQTNGNVRNSLKDRFKAMRMREEAGITALPDDGDTNGIADLVNKGPNNLAATPSEEKTEGAVQPPPSPRPAHATLAPGTASGATAGPSTLSDQPVDWDLWQSVVYEGPAAVAKTSAEELSRAIATGIPSAIRGVIWQVLAQSQNQELEAVYRDLVARGTDKEVDTKSNGSVGSGSSGSVKDTGSSASSVHSGDSTSNGAPSPAPKDFPKEDEEQRKKKKKEDVAMIQRLEKTIRRDLGQRTAFSKYASAQGLQEGLYGVCKAYALFDEDVGYAQGMNFLIMPLLFNVR